MHHIRVTSDITGDILDIGGGGNGIISRVYGDRVTAIDRLQSELDEAPDLGTKLLMDARDLRFEDARFENITLFYALMFISKSDHPQVFREAWRVLKPGGHVYIWDCNIPSAYPEVFTVSLSIDCGGRETVRTTYGVVEKNAVQSAASVLAVAASVGLTLSKSSEQDGQFHLVLEKQHISK